MHPGNPQQWQTERAKGLDDSYNATEMLRQVPLSLRGLGGFCKSCCQSSLPVFAELINSSWIRKGAGGLQ
jgi:hypothetical protein